VPGLGRGHPEVMTGDVILRGEGIVPISDQIEGTFDRNPGLLAAAECFKLGQEIGRTGPRGRQLFSKCLADFIILPADMVVDEASEVLIEGIKKPDQRMWRVLACW